LVVLYSIYGGNPSGKTTAEKYPLPQEISVIKTDLPYQKRGDDKVVKTSDIPFDKHFFIRTSRYTLSKNQDWFPSRLLGHIASLPLKAYFWDWDMGWGPDKDRARAALSMLEKDSSLDNLTIRLNHNEPLKDLGRLFSEEKLTKRNPVLARATLGLLSTLGGELFAELSRSDYYNPYTHTAVNYSNVESIFAHEVGHSKDFQRFKHDWIYSLARVIPPVMLYQEWQASSNAKKVMSKDDKNQFFRYLIPAFMTYVLSVLRVNKKVSEARKRRRSSFT